MAAVGGGVWVAVVGGGVAAVGGGVAAGRRDRGQSGGKRGNERTQWFIGVKRRSQVFVRGRDNSSVFVTTGRRSLLSISVVRPCRCL